MPPDLELGIEGEHKAIQFATVLIHASIPFTLDPFPDDVWCFTFPHRDSNPRVLRLAHALST